MHCLESEPALESPAPPTPRGFFRRHWLLLGLLATFAAAHFVKCQFAVTVGWHSFLTDVSSGGITLQGQSWKVAPWSPPVRARFWLESPELSSTFFWYHKKTMGMWMLGFPLWLPGSAFVFWAAFRQWRRHRRRTAREPSAALAPFENPAL